MLLKKGVENIEMHNPICNMHFGTFKDNVDNWVFCRTLKFMR